jgi:hypothetical protein
MPQALLLVIPAPARIYRAAHRFRAAQAELQPQRNSDHVVLAVSRAMTVERRAWAWQKGRMANEESEPNLESDNATGPTPVTHNPVSKRAAIAAKARENPKEQSNNLLHHLTY